MYFVTEYDLLYTEIPFYTNPHPLTFARQVLNSTYYANVKRVRTSISNTTMWALQKVGFTASAKQVAQP